MVSGTAFAGAAIFHGVRVKSLWNFYPVKEKVFNLFGLLFLAGISAANYNAAYQIKMGQTMQLIEYRPSLLSRLTGGAAAINGNLQSMNPKQRQEYLEYLIKLEEEKV